MPRKIKPLTGNFGDFSGIVLKAAASGNLTAVKHYLSVNPDWLNQLGPHNRTLLWEAAYKGRVEFIEWLITQGANIDAFGSYYTPMLVELSALAAALYAGHDEAANLLISEGARDDVYAACHRGDLDATKQFALHDPTIVNRPSFDGPAHRRMGYHPIHYAVAGGHVETIAWLIEQGARIAPHMVLLNDWCEINRSVVLPILSRQAESESSGSSRRKKRKSRVPTIDQPDWLGFPPLVDACRGNHNAADHPFRVSNLLDQGANINITDHKGKTPLHRASQAGFVKIAQLLIDNGADLEITGKKLETPIFDAAFYGREKTVRLLLDSGANKEHCNFRGDTPVFAAVKSKRIQTLAVLLDSGANIQHKNSKGKSVENLLLNARHLSTEQKAMLRLLRSRESRQIRKKK